MIGQALVRLSGETLMALWCCFVAAHAAEAAPHGLAPASTLGRAAVVTVYHIRDYALLGDLKNLKDLRQATGAGDHVELAGSFARVLADFVLDRDGKTFVHKVPGKPSFVTACAFAPDYVFEFRAPDKPPVWWLLASGCWKSSLVDSGMDQDEWTAREQYLSASAIARLEKCNGATDGSGAWRWPADPACLDR